MLFPVLGIRASLSASRQESKHKALVAHDIRVHAGNEGTSHSSVFIEGPQEPGKLSKRKEQKGFMSPVNAGAGARIGGVCYWLCWPLGSKVRGVGGHVCEHNVLF